MIFKIFTRFLRFAFVLIVKKTPAMNIINHKAAKYLCHGHGAPLSGPGNTRWLQCRLSPEPVRLLGLSWTGRGS